MNNRVYYNSNLDRSEEFGWKKLCDEHVPTEDEQDRWGTRLILAASILSSLVLIIS